MSRLKDDDMKKYSDSKRFITWTKVWLTISGIIFISFRWIMMPAFWDINII